MRLLAEIRPEFYIYLFCPPFLATWSSLFQISREFFNIEFITRLQSSLFLVFEFDIGRIFNDFAISPRIIIIIQQQIYVINK